jgi:hypothetical protein
MFYKIDTRRAERRVDDLAASALRQVEEAVRTLQRRRTPEQLDAAGILSQAIEKQRYPGRLMGIYTKQGDQMSL